MSKKLKVLSIQKGTQAEKLGIKVGDLIVSYNGKLVSSNADLSSVISEAKETAVESVILVVSRKDQEMSLQVSLEALGMVCDEVSDTVDAPSNKATVNSYKTNYGTARSTSTAITFIGWAMVFIGAIATFIAIVSGLDSEHGGLALLGVLPGFGIAVSGLLLIVAAQVTLAIVDNADHTREILKILNKQ